MATRVISTKLAIEGENSYRQSISKINTEIKALKSSLALTESQFQTNANSMQALEEKGKALSSLYEAQKNKVDSLKAALENARAAEENYQREKESLTEKIRANNEALEKLKNTEGDTSQQEKELTAENKRLTSQLEACDGRLSAAERGVASWKNQLNNAEIQLNDLDAQIKLNNGYLEEAKQSSDGCATSIDQFGDQVESAAKSSDTLTDALATAGVIAALKKTADMFESCAGSSIEFESAMAGVAKTTDLSTAELAAMGKNIQELSHRIPASTTEIAAVAESAGQLGIAKEDLLSFSEVMLNLGTATNLSSEEAASALAKFANVVKMSPQDYSRLGSTIVDLGNNFATTEADIVSMATRLASTGAVVGLSEPQIMAIATALNSVGIEAEAGGSSVSKLLKNFETMVATGSEELEGYAEIAGMTAEQFRVAWGRDAVGAMSSFIDGLGEIDRSGGSVAAVLSELGITEARMSNAVLALASSDGILKKALDTADTAWDADTALSKEASTRYSTTESKLQMLQNKAETLKTTFGDQMNPLINGFADGSGEVLDWATGMVEQCDYLAPLLASCATGMGLFVAAVGGYKLIGGAANTLLAGFTAAATAHPIFLTAAAVAAIAGAFALFINATDGKEPEKTVEDFTKYAQGLPEAMSKADEAFDQSESKINSTVSIVDRYIARLKVLEGQESLTAEEQAEYNLILEKIKGQIPELNFELDNQTGLLKGGAEALREQVQEWKNLAIQEALHEKLTAQLKAYADAETELEENRKKRDAAESEYLSLEKQSVEITKSKAEAEKQLRAIKTDKAGNIIKDDDIDKWNEWNDQLSRANAAEYELTEKRSEARKELDLMNEVVRTGEEALAGYEEEIKNGSESLQRLTEESAAAASGGLADSKEAIDAVSEKLNKLAQDYKAAYDAAYESISGQIGLFDEFKDANKETDLTAEQMINRMQTQARNLSAYTENLRKAQEYGLSPALIQQLSDGTAQSAKYIATIVSEIEKAGGSASGMSATAKTLIEEFNASISGTEDAKVAFAQTVAEIQTNLEQSLTDLEHEASDAHFSGFAEAVKKAFETAGVDFEKIGSDAAAGLVKGMSDSKQEVADAGKDMGQAGVDGIKEQLDSHSPSKVFEKIGDDSGEGLCIGLKNKIDDIKDAAKSVGLKLSEEMASAAKQAADAYDEKLKAVAEKTRSILAALSTAAASGAAGLPGQMKTIGESAIDGMIVGMNNRSSALYAAIQSIVGNSILTAKNAADVHSPSGKTREIFEYVGDGMILGLENRRKKLADTAQDVVNQALAFETKGRVLELAAGIDTRMPELVYTYGNGYGFGGSAQAGSNVTVNLSIDRFENNSDRDLDSITAYIEERIQTNFYKKEAAV